MRPCVVLACLLAACLTPASLGEAGRGPLRPRGKPRAGRCPRSVRSLPATLSRRASRYSGPPIRSHGAELYDALRALRFRATPPSEPDRLVPVAELDAKLVAALGLSDASRAIRLAVQNAGLASPSFIGTETVSRLLGLRINHPQGEEYLEVGPREPASRAEAAFSWRARSPSPRHRRRTSSSWPTRSSFPS